MGKHPFYTQLASARTHPAQPAVCDGEIGGERGATCVLQQKAEARTACSPRSSSREVRRIWHQLFSALSILVREPSQPNKLVKVHLAGGPSLFTIFPTLASTSIPPVKALLLLQRPQSQDLCRRSACVEAVPCFVEG